MRRRTPVLAFLCFLLSGLLSGGDALWAGPAYTLTLLGQLPDEPNSMAMAINNAGQIAGFSEDFGSGTPHAFLWQPGSGLEDLNSLIGENTSFAKGINQSAQIVGSAAGTDTHPFLWQSGSPTQFLPYSTNSNANAINDSGEVAGVNDFQACLWKNGNAQILGNGAAYAINAGGEVAGQAVGSSGDHACVWQSGGGMQQLDIAGGWTSSCAYGINQGGAVVGYGDTSSGPCHAFLWQSGSGMQDLDPADAFSTSYAFGINDSQQVVGWASNGVQFAFLWEAATGIENLNDLVAPSPGFTLTEATAINQSGQVVGWGTASGGEREAFLLTPARLPGDANGDGQVDINDLTIVLAHFGQTGCAWSQGSMDGDPAGTVDINDLTIVLASFGTSLAASGSGALSAVPEPCALAIVAAGLTLLLPAVRSAATPRYTEA